MYVHIVSFAKHWVQVWILYWAPAPVGWRTTTGGTTADVAWLSVCACVLRYSADRSIKCPPYTRSHTVRSLRINYVVVRRFFFCCSSSVHSTSFCTCTVKRLWIIRVCFISTSRLFLLEPYIRTHAVYKSLNKTLHGGLPVIPIN